VSTASGAAYKHLLPLLTSTLAKHVLVGLHLADGLMPGDGGAIAPLVAALEYTSGAEDRLRRRPLVTGLIWAVDPLRRCLFLLSLHMQTLLAYKLLLINRTTSVVSPIASGG
jgi:hypothetical protein